MYNDGDFIKIGDQPFKIAHVTGESGRSLYYFKWLHKNSTPTRCSELFDLNGLFRSMFNCSNAKETFILLQTHNPDLRFINNFHADSPDFESLEMINKAIQYLEIMYYANSIKLLN